MRSKLYILLLVLSALSGNAQEITPAQGLEMLKDLYATIQQRSSLSDSTAFYMNYKMTSVASSAFGGKTSVTEVESLSSKKFAKFMTQQMEIYQDGQLKMLVSTADRKITLMNTTPKALNDVFVNQFSSMKDSLLSIVTVDKVSRLKENIEVVVSIPKKFSSSYTMRSIRYVFDYEKKELKEVEIYYNGKGKLTQMKIEFLRMDFNYPVASLEMNPLEISRLEKYAHYQIKDLRNKSH